MAKPEELVAAGACLSIKEKLKNESLVDSVSARLYRHPALGGRPVVRLSADNLAEGDDLTMEFLGFTKPEVTGPVAKRRRQALGFPGWAIINDPKHARYALELVKEFKHAVRRSKAKPGFGYDEFTAISKRLGKSVAHFLPSFWEQAGREFIALDNATYGSRAFGKAREAEKVHALKVDESLRGDAFLEFALAGAVSIKALTEYGKELSSTHDPQAAWKFFRELCVRRTLGGMPPWTSMVKDLQPLLKAAGLNAEQEIQSILLEIIDSPAISRAPMGFWEGASKAVEQLVKKDPHVAGILLNMIPQTSTWRNEDIWPWLTYLDTWGILPNAWKEGVKDEAAPHGGPAAWLTRLIQTIQRPRQIIYDIVKGMADRLRKDNVPIDLCSKNRWSHLVSADVDLLDLTLDLKIPFLDVPGEVTLDLAQWANPDEPLAKLRNRPRDPVHLVADARFTRSLHDALQKAAGESLFEHAAEGKVALREARRNWLRSLVNGLTNGGLPRIESSLQLLETKTRQAIFREFPDVLEELKAANISPAVARSVRGGLMDEYGWPALERVHESFVAANKSDPSVFGHFPYIILTDRQRAVVIRGDEIVHEAELKLTKGHELKSLCFIDGDLLVFSEVNYQSRAFWNSDPQPCEPEYAWFPPELSGVSIEVPGGGTFVGEKIVHRGQKGLSSVRATSLVVSDGTHWWLKSVESYDPSRNEQIFALHEIDPVTAKKGRKSLPSFFEDFVQNDSQLELPHCSLLPVGASFPSTPLGKQGGLIGYRVRRRPDGNVRMEGVDGRAIEFSGQTLFGYLLDQPGTTDRLPVESLSARSRAIGFKFWDPTGSYEVADVAGGGDGYSRGQVTGVSAIYLHAFQVRDVAASKKLRAITDKQVQTLLEAEQQDFANFTNGIPATAEAGSPASPKPRSALSAVTQKLSLRDEAAHSHLLDGAIRELLGAKVHPRLLTGLRGVMIRAGQKVRQLIKLIDNRATAPVAQAATIEVAAADTAAMPFLTSIQYRYGHRIRQVAHFSFIESVENVAKFLTGGSAFVRFPLDWVPVLRTLTGGVAQRLWQTYATDPADQKWIPFADIWSRLAYHRLPGSFRIFIGEKQDETLFAAEIAALAADTEQTELERIQWQWAIPYIGKSSRYLIEKNYRGYEVLEYSPTGQFESIPGLAEDLKAELIVPPAFWSPEALRSFAELAKKNSINIPAAALLKSLAADVKASVAEVALVWFGLPGFDDSSANFMPTPLREALKLKTKECSAAKESLKQMKPNLLQSLVRSVVAGDPADLWEQPPTKVADRLRAAWSGTQPDRILLSVEWVETISATLPYDFNKGQFFQALQNPGAHPLFSDQGAWAFCLVRGYAEITVADPQHQFNDEVLQAAGTTIGLLSYGLPVGVPARNKLVAVYQATLKALANPGLLLSAGYRYESMAFPAAKVMELMESVVGKRQTQDFLDIADDGTVVVARDDHRIETAFRPAKVTKPAHMERLVNQLHALCQSEEQEGFLLTDNHRRLQLIRSSDFQAIIDRIEKSPVPAGSYEANPLHSAPELVKQIAKKHKLSDDAAVYYLQLLALADPTDKNVTLWNGWTTAAIKALGAELVGKQLVLEAARTRAGRKFFLPGGWEDYKAPHLPLETWKVPLFQIRRDAYNRLAPPLGRIVPLEPVHSLFAKAWQRILDGDVPEYEEVK
ncbi:MAG: hypothetical protein JWN70_5674 [Planctomycetaceae bacterium]|nr:hypothetical protein [Planctomycetaceae bacterium]